MGALFDECEKAGLDPNAVTRICSGLARYGKQADELGLTVFGGSGSGSLRAYPDAGRPLVVGTIGRGVFDGGDGACFDDDDGLMRGE